MKLFPRRDKITVKGRLDILHVRNGKVIARRSLRNLIVDAGFNSIIRTNILQLESDATHIDGAKYVAVGTYTIQGHAIWSSGANDRTTALGTFSAEAKL